jgi:hypothetical protein
MIERARARIKRAEAAANAAITERQRIAKERVESQLRLVGEQQNTLQRLAEQSRELDARVSRQEEHLRGLHAEEAKLRSAILHSISAWVGKAMANATTVATSRAQELIVRLLRDGKLSLDIVIAVQNVLLERARELNGWDASVRPTADGSRTETGKESNTELGLGPWTNWRDWLDATK